MNKKRENFKRIAENRTNKILSMIELLGNLSNKSYYEFEQDDVDKIFSAIEDALKVQKNKFKPKQNKKIKFKL